MAELERLMEMLRQQRQELDDEQDQTLTRRTATADLVGKIEDLRRRSEDTRRRYEASVADTQPQAPQPKAKK